LTSRRETLATFRAVAADLESRIAYLDLRIINDANKENRHGR
jgi:hypothetical protein